MFDNDDIRYSRPEERPPWELSTSGQIRDLFSNRKVDEARSCGEVERQKARHVEAQARQQERHQAAQAQREERQRRMDARPEEEPAETPPQPEDPRARRYDYSDTLRPGRKPRRSNFAGLAVLVALALVITAVAQIGVGAFGDYEIEVAPEPDYEAGDSQEWYPDEEDPYGEAEIDPDEYFGGEYAYEEYPSASQQELPRTELTDPMEMEIVSDGGKRALSYQEVYAKCAPSTVSITVYSETGVGTGTGIIMTDDGYILTCEHVIADGVSCTVTTWDDQVYDALLVGGDAQTDLAVLKIEARGLTPAEFGDSDELTVGDEALAIGDPLGTELRGTLTNGIISAINRNVTVNSYSMTLIQTTAALNSGNSGGPLINIYGQVVGVNNMKMNSTDVTVEGLGFAVPTSVVREIVPGLTGEGKISRPVMGITCYSIDQAAAEAYGYPTAGLVVASVNRDSDCYKQGLRVDDMIWAIDGQEVWDVSQVKEILDELEVGDSVTVSVIRFEEEAELEVAEEFELEVELVDQSEIS